MRGAGSKISSKKTTSTTPRRPPSTRIVTPAGKSRSFVNDIPVQLAALRELGTRLIDIHSQHRNLILSSEDFRISALDTIAGNGELLSQYGAQYKQLTELARRLAALREAAEEGRRNEEWLRFQAEELTAADLRAGEQAEIEEELAVLENADRIGEALGGLCNALETDETGILSQLKNAETALTHVQSHYPAAGEYAARIRSVLEELKDIGSSATADSERIDADPARLAKLSGRLDTLLALQQKHRTADEAELIAVRDRCLLQLAAIDHGSEAIAEAENALQKAQEKTEKLAEKLRKARAKARPAWSANHPHDADRPGHARNHIRDNPDAYNTRAYGSRHGGVPLHGQPRSPAPTHREDRIGR